ncbi:methylated-DNA--[protein]-cysteine S-methyltransferase [Mesorhizobium sp. M7A.F.Ca.US.006.04.2.1]|uniref:methylated-DNA--[protein]-cysteine S-methyltransferase n=1 Tax=unclassified Mesorhizobium TaxID=325217 RepID=UPI000FCCCE35|nr:MULTISPECIES: methylated-DNA--[protein]-cysteine S-methyltransferase [unclassified Mesorhizobium]RUX73951.1 methylated-DNA--[protein]-cysteine S-methyltransferase [Mesorhizobium sp. M7A.F.Ca.US.005.03.1.1]RUY16120.1 methylated-DNA--[protein]-cysteine S-methyltransferase [Mesorhizobium sp. M7A.F.Ca.US.005.03.2.1]RUY22266.1 methylated-DNA--[protein]-cysteine S-methyltransferase [Mesorhizobium sp. M7A.F.Ca.US.001.04.2.1]RUY37222.1 methylated-DNA--[protein]-cysteine S-methyltransferase [Mesorhiz
MNLVQTNIPATVTKLAALDIITYAIGESAIGKILAARSQIGVCAILIGSDADALERDLGHRFPGKLLVEDRATLRDDLAAIARFVEIPGVGLDLPLDLRRGTPFQQRVWEALRGIPCGATITYAALAQRLGQPDGARAVATACAANAIALGIPCHRVVRADGTLSGYRWGLERKRALIDKEATI